MDPVMTPLESAAWRVLRWMDRGKVTNRERRFHAGPHTYRVQEHDLTGVCSGCERRAARDELHAALTDARDARVAAMRATGTEG